MTTSLRGNLQLKHILPSLTIGVVFGIRNAVVYLAFALMIFSGDLSSQITVGITILLLGSTIHSLVATLGSSLPGIMSGVQDSPSVILAVVIGSMLAVMSQASLETKLYTALAAIMLTSLLTGLICLLLGKFKLGGLVSYIPYPVVGGFLAGTGVLLVLGALKLMIGTSVSLFDLVPLFRVDTLWQWVAGVAFAVILFAIMKRVSHYLVLPGMLVGTIALFYLILAASGTSIMEAMELGWLVKGAPQQGGALFRFWNPAGFAKVDWNVLLGQTGSLLACVVVSLISLLLNTTALELSTGQEIDLNTELKVNGWANMIAGAAGSVIGYTALSNTTLAYRIGARSRLNGIVVAAVIALILVFGGGLLGYFPNPVLGGLLFFIGIEFLYSWLYQTWFSMPRSDYAILVLIALLINTLGFLPGVGIGLVMAVILFVLQYSRTRAIRHILSGISYQSSVERTNLGADLLRRHGDWLYILELQGFIFFGTANQVLEQIRARLNSSSGKSPRFIILDFRLVSGVDSSAAFSFAKIKRITQERGIALVLTHTTPNIQKQLKKDLPPESFHYFPDLDRGIEWLAKPLGRDTLLIAVNADRNPVDVTFEGLGRFHRCGSMFEPRPVA
ncbi:MAG: SulP family inorganic anion transporter, partial [Anaerolineales bacterium]|nr:SulP family inorganic anion transporter [Anaerolineales bacterium]